MVGWGGVGGFITGYGEGALAGPVTDSPSQANRAQLLTGAMVVSLGNTAISFGQEETSWGVSHYNQLSQSNNGQPFPALRIQSIHPGHLPWIFRYLGCIVPGFSGAAQFGTNFSRPWLSGHDHLQDAAVLRMGLEHTIMFGGSGNDNYGPGGFLGNLTGLSTGNSAQSNTNSRFGIFGKVYIKRLRDTQIYAEDLAEDFFNAGGQSGFKLPFKGPSYTAGIYVPRLTLDGRTTARFEYALTDKEYSVHSDSLYWTYNNALMGSSLGPGAWQANFEIDRWVNLQSRVGIDTFYTRRQAIAVAVLFSAARNTETGYGLALNFLHLPLRDSAAGEFARRDESARGHGIRDRHQLHQLKFFPRTLQLSLAFNPAWGGLVSALNRNVSPVN